LQALVNPADQVAVTDVPNEQEQAIGHPVQGPVAQGQSGQGTGWIVGGLSADSSGADEVAAVKVPVAFQLRAGGLVLQTASHVVPTGSAVLVHEGERGGIRNPLQAQDLDQPGKQGRGVVSPNRGHDASVSQTLMETGEVAGLGRKAAYGEEER
jgi:hypothetical protein